MPAFESWYLSKKEIRVLKETAYPLRQQFTGYLMSFDTRDYYWRMAGVFGKVEDGVYTEQAGWFATRPREE